MTQISIKEPFSLEAYAISLPSGDHRGYPSPTAASKVICATPVPSGFIVWSSPPSRVLTDRILLRVQVGVEMVRVWVKDER